jgi:hypothetical protein
MKTHGGVEVYTSTLDAGEWLASRSGILTPEKEA